ncbi:PIG-L family deacetylase [Micromonospora aurantiaca]|uniref:PIG-L family deacetylase n=1 Tax=Micromonospora aurantiaca (nom. illeg.) TaxID=47850 RepID=A0ABQ6U7B3_9ACTN|nr:PIG-L family deacetylase [Micromonospora aurantiaca]
MVPHGSSERVLIVAAHADDEILGAGGTLALHKAYGDSLFVLVLSASSVSRTKPERDPESISHRGNCAARVARMYDAQLHIATFPDNSFDVVPQLEISKAIEQVVHGFGPTIVYTHSLADLSRDHELTARATAIATRPIPGSTVRLVLGFEVRSATEWGVGRDFHPNWFVPLTAAAVEMKMSALRVYESEMRDWPHTRSLDAIDAIMKVRGSQIGAEAAEAFELMRYVARPEFRRPIGS